MGACPPAGRPRRSRTAGWVRVGSQPQSSSPKATLLHAQQHRSGGRWQLGLSDHEGVFDAPGTGRAREGARLGELAGGWACSSCCGLSKQGTVDDRRAQAQCADTAALAALQGVRAVACRRPLGQRRHRASAAPWRAKGAAPRGWAWQSTAWGVQGWPRWRVRGRKHPATAERSGRPFGNVSAEACMPQAPTPRRSRGCWCCCARHRRRHGARSQRRPAAQTMAGRAPATARRAGG